MIGPSYTYLKGLSGITLLAEVVVNTGQRNLDTVEVRSSSLLVPTIFFNGLASTCLALPGNGTVERAHESCTIVAHVFDSQRLQPFFNGLAGKTSAKRIYVSSMSPLKVHHRIPAYKVAIFRIFIFCIGK